MVFGRDSHCVLLMLGALLSAPGLVLAKETDQFTVPPRPLADIGPEVQRIVTGELQRVLDEVNKKLFMHRDRAAVLPPGEAREYNEEQVVRLMSRAAVAKQLHDAIGEGFPESRLELLIYEHHFARQPAAFEITCEESVFAETIVLRPLVSIGMVPTIHCFGVYFGTDKLGHMFQQGYEYVREFERQIRRRKSRAAALERAVAHGMAQERTYFGYLPTGAYSNGDLAANVAGLMFYLNLTEPVEFGTHSLPPILIVDRAQGWRMNPSAQRLFMRPFITDHLNEAMNPAEYDWTMRDSIRTQIEQRLDAWLAFYRTTPKRERDRTRNLTRWHGVDYGHSGVKNLITIADLATAREAPTRSASDEHASAGKGGPAR